MVRCTIFAVYKMRDIMKTYITIDRKATMANSKKEASKKLGVSVGNVHISSVHITILTNHNIID